MRPGTVNSAADLDDFIEAFERARGSDSSAAIADYVPPSDHPIYLPVLRELVRVDLEHGWQRGGPRTLDDYRAAFPALFQHGPSVRDIAFEEYRLRAQAGQQVHPGEYHERFGVDVSDWPIATPARGSDLLGPADAAPTAMPEPGQEFLGFQLVEELGRGTFGRVFLARQPGLANRLVALKISTELWDESQTLAQLQHTHIVPIYSIHRSGAFQAVVMPYLGAATLADVLRDLHEQRALPDSGKGLFSTVASRRRLTVRSPDSSPAEHAASAERESRPMDLEKLAGMTYEDAVLWLAARLADGLAHAHERGILHRDLKPANVLLTDDGRPMLLDFNLSEDTKRRGASAALVGGTLPYMAPEHLEAFDRGGPGVDARADIYSLGVILHELLTGRLPFAVPHGPLPAVLAAIRQDRHQPPPRLRNFNPRVSPAVESIVRHCLEPDARQRYQTARELEEDLKQHLENRPLRHAPEPSLRERARKLVRRHPRLAAAGTVAALAAVALLALGTVLAVTEIRLAQTRSQNAILNATAQRGQFQQEMREAQVRFLSGPDEFARGHEQCVHALERYRVMDNPAWMDQPAVRLLPQDEQQQLQEDVGELLLLWARAAVEQAPSGKHAAEALALNEQAEACFSGGLVPRVVRLQRAGLLDLLGRADEATQLRATVLNSPIASARDLALLASEHTQAGRLHEALPLLRRATRLEPQRFTLAFDLACCCERLDRHAEAVAWYNTAIALSPRLAPLYLRRGVAHLRQKDYAPAIADLDEARQLDPKLACDCLLNRALVHIGLKQYPEAIGDLTAAEKQGAPRVRVFLVRARVRQLMGDPEPARHDRALGLREKPGDEASWLARGSTQIADNPKAALRDFDETLRRYPRSLSALQNKAHLLAERLNRPDEAIATLNELVRAYPDYAPGWAGRGVLRARKGDRAGALGDARKARTLDAKPATLYRLGCVYALTSRQGAEDRREALALLSAALGSGYGLDLVDRDTDLDAIRASPEFRRMVESARNLRMK